MTRPQSIAIPIAGWDITYDPDHDYVAIRTTALSPYQTMHGAAERIFAENAGELWVLCDAQTRLAERLHTAEQIVQADKQVHQRDQRIAEIRSREGIPGGDVGSGPGPRLA